MNLREAAEAVVEQLKGGWVCESDPVAQDLKAALAEPVQEQDIEDAIEAAYWQFDCRRSGLNEWASAPQSERDAFKAEARKLVRGYFPTRQAQDTKREMLAVVDAFIRGKHAALAEHYCDTHCTWADHAAGCIRAEPTWCEIHQHHKWCEHNGGKMGPTGWEAP